MFRSCVLSLILIVFFAVTFTACGGGATTYTPLATPAAIPSATAAAGTATATVSVSNPSGYAATVSLPATADGSSGTISAILSTTLPTGFVTPSSVQRIAASARRAPATIGVTLTPVAYVVLTPTANVSFASTPGFTFTVPAAMATSLANSAYVAFDDPSQSTGWTNILGPGTVSGNTISFAGAPGSLLLKGGRSYGFLLYSTAQPVPVVAAPTASGPQLVLDLTQTNLPTGTPVYIYVIGTIKTTSTDYWMQPSSLLQTTTRTAVAPGSTVIQPAQMQAMVPGNPTPAQPNCANNGDDTNYFSCNNNQLNALPSPQASAINGGGGTGGNYPSAWADYGIPATIGTKLSLPLSAISKLAGLGTGTSAFSGRIYVSVGTPKLPITPVSASGYTAPVFGNGTGQPGEWTLFDWIEFSYDSNGVFNGNTTQVNQFGFPMQLSGVAGTGTLVAPPQVLTASRNTILNYFATQPAPVGGTGTSLGSVVVSVPAGAPSAYPAGLTYLRAIAPQTIVAVGAYSGPLTTTFASEISAAYTAWQTTPLVTFEQSTQVYYTGVVFPTNNPSIPTPAGYVPGSLAFFGPSTGSGYPNMTALSVAVALGQTAYAFSLTGTGVDPGPQNVISSIDVWTNQNSLATGGADEKNVGKMLAAAFNRGVAVSPAGVVTSSLNDATCQTAPATYENSLYPVGGTYNWWAQYFHQNTATISPNVTGLAYAFSYDDVCDQNPSVSFTPGTVTVTLGNF